MDILSKRELRFFSAEGRRRILKTLAKWSKNKSEGSIYNIPLLLSYGLSEIPSVLADTPSETKHFHPLGKLDANGDAHIIFPFIIENYIRVNGFGELQVFYSKIDDLYITNNGDGSFTVKGGHMNFILTIYETTNLNTYTGRINNQELPTSNIFPLGTHTSTYGLPFIATVEQDPKTQSNPNDVVRAGVGREYHCDPDIFTQTDQGLITLNGNVLSVIFPDISATFGGCFSSRRILDSLTITF